MYSTCMLPYEIEPAVLAALLKAPEDARCIVLDVREPWEIETAHLHGSVNVPMGEIPSRSHSELDPDRHTIVICHHGVRSLSVTAWLRREGFEQTQSLTGGIDAWSAIIDPSIPRY